MGLKVAIIGAGISGLTALKHCLCDAIVGATVFEARDSVGGQWNYQYPNPDAGATASSIYDSLVMKSCRDTTAFSDRPIDPERYPEFLTHAQFLAYIREYVAHYQLMAYIQLNTRVISCRQLEGSEKWVVVSLKNGEGNEPVEQIFDAVIACSGLFSKPYIPEFKNMGRFKGEVLHSQVYRNPSPFDGKRVAVIGFEDSAADISCEVRNVAKEVHLITRRGGWVMPRSIFGKPTETYQNRFTESILPSGMSEWCQVKLAKHVMGEPPESIKPKHQLMQAGVAVKGDMFDNIKSGRITAHRAGIERFTKRSIVLDNGTRLEVDVVICCTGYHLDIPYLLPEYYRKEGQDNPFHSPNASHLYKQVVSPRHPNLFCIGYVTLDGALPPVSEAQARWAVSIINRQTPLPSIEDMEASIQAYQEELAATMLPSNRNANTIRSTPYCDDLYADLNATPTLFRLVSHIYTSLNPLRAARILLAVYLGIRSPAQYRLFGHGSMSDLAGETLLRLERGDGKMGERERYLAERYNVGLSPKVFGWRWW